MPVQIDTTAENNGLRLVDQGSHPSAPSVNHTLLYVITGTNAGLYIQDDAGKKIGPFITGSVAGSGGALILLEQHTASSSATLDFTTAFSSTYDDYLIEIVNLFPVTDNVTLELLVSTNGGVSYDSGANYSWTGYFVFAGSSGIVGGGGTGKSFIQLPNAVSNNASYGLNGNYKLINPVGSTYKEFSGDARFFDNGAGIGKIQSFGWYISTTAVNAIRFLFSSGNIASGTIRVYGIAH